MTVLPNYKRTLLTVLCIATALLLVLPLIFMLIQASQVGLTNLDHLIFRNLTATLLINTVELSALVCIISCVIGTTLAVMLNRFDFKFAGLISTLFIIPLAIPDFVIGYAYNSMFPNIAGLFGAVIVMALNTFPLVFLPVNAAMKRTNQSLTLVAKTFGFSRFKIFRKVTFPQIKTSITGGCLLVVMVLLSEYGAFEILRFNTFTTEIFSQYQIGFNSPNANALSLVLVIIAMTVLFFEYKLSKTYSRPLENHFKTVPQKSNLSAGIVFYGISALLVTMSVGLPLYVILFWIFHNNHADAFSLPLFPAFLHTVEFALFSGLISTAMAIPIAFYSVRSKTKLSVLIDRSSFLIQSMPSLVVALSMVFFAIRYFRFLYQSPILTILAYSLLFFPLALVSIKGTLTQISPVYEQVSKTLGYSSLMTFFKVTLRLLMPGIVSAFSLVFLSTVTELTLTLVLVPNGVNTLATAFWVFETNSSYSQAAPFALTMVLMAAVPSFGLNRWFAKSRHHLAEAT
jgi:iron(III) transport system permease protein